MAYKYILNEQPAQYAPPPPPFIFKNKLITAVSPREDKPEGKRLTLLHRDNGPDTID